MLFSQGKQEEIYQRNRQKSWVKSLPFQQLTPPIGTGKIIKISQNNENLQEFYIALEDSGVWHTINGGQSFSLIFSDKMLTKIETFGIDWASKTIWISNKNQMAYTEDNGQNWTFIKKPNNLNISNFFFFSSNEFLICSDGKNGTDKGIFKTSDKGKSWFHHLPEIPIINIVVAPENPQTIYATAWDTEQEDGNFIASGSKSGIYKSTNGGNSWNIISENNSFISNNIGKISLAVFNQNSLYALVDNRSLNKEKDKVATLSKEDFLQLTDNEINKFLYNYGLQEKFSVENCKQIIKDDIFTPSQLASQGEFIKGAELYHSSDGGNHWKKIETNLNEFFFNKGFEVSALAVHPKNERELYASGVPLLHSTDGGKNWKLLKNNELSNKVADLFVSEKNIVYANNQGIFQSWDNGENWQNIHIPQTIKVSSLHISPNDENEILASFENFGAWSFQKQWKKITDKNGKVFSNSTDNQFITENFGTLFSVNKNKYLLPKYAKNQLHRFSKNTPLLVSPHNPSIFYMGSQFLLQSFNEGKDWSLISSNLTNTTEVGNQSFGTISAISESPFQFGLLYTGSDDGMIYTSRNSGASWQLIYSSFSEKNSVTSLVSSRYEKGRIYAVLKNQSGKALIFRSNNFGKNWVNLQANLPNQTINILVEDPQNPQILYIGTENGVYISFDLGENWHLFQKNLPRTSVTHIAIDSQSEKLYIGTAGRGIFRADIGVLKELKVAIQNQIFYPMKDSYMIKHAKNWGNSESVWQEVFVPKFYLESFSSVDNQRVTIKIIQNEIILNSYEYTTEKGFNFVDLDLKITQNLNAFLEKNKTLKKSSDGNYYLPKGKYEVLFSFNETDEIRPLFIE